MNSMKFAAVTLLLAVLATANPAPVARPDATAAPALKAQPIEIDTRAQLEEALTARNPEPVPEVVARAAGIQLAPRDPKKKPKTSSSGDGNDTDAAVTLTASRALQLGALGLGVVEVVRLWG
ncbi:hypothetical protein CC78DRAFT_385501 [Lojkania enalia]|uniref:Uncharacterized protein n=1 Tax=Lojkania enalia TaxID=147567 RepID=A0A9P4MZY1_9PLEO|nr:hypothetical protein CC78DRAFT_385501 [Didymosphaeria enalia]